MQQRLHSAKAGSRRFFRLACCLAFGLLGLSGCNSTRSDLGGFTAIDIPEEFAFPSGVLPIGGYITFKPDGCIWLNTDDGTMYWTAWPSGSELLYESDEILLSSGVKLKSGDHITGNAWITERTDLPDGDEPDSYWGSYSRVCPPSSSPVAIISEVDEVKPR